MSPFGPMAWLFTGFPFQTDFSLAKWHIKIAGISLNTVLNLQGVDWSTIPFFDNLGGATNQDVLLLLFPAFNQIMSA